MSDDGASRSDYNVNECRQICMVNDEASSRMSNESEIFLYTITANAIAQFSERKFRLFQLHRFLHNNCVNIKHFICAFEKEN